MAKKTIRTIPQERTPIPVQEPEERVRNFERGGARLRRGQALLEAERCLMCPQPACVPAARSHIDIPAFIERIIEVTYAAPTTSISDANLLPPICGRVCPQEDQCEGSAPWARRWSRWPSAGWSAGSATSPSSEGWANVPYVDAQRLPGIGIVGSGPAGVACAADMAKAGCECHRTRPFTSPAAFCATAFPEFRLPERGDRRRNRPLVQLGVRKSSATRWSAACSRSSRCSRRWASTPSSSAPGRARRGSWGSRASSLNGVLSANELLTRCNLMHAGDFPSYDTPLGLGKRVAVIGAGNTAMDAMRVSLRARRREGALRLPPHTRRSPARREELEHAEEEGVEFHWLTAPVEVLDDGEGNVRWHALHPDGAR
jgi:glutamate synthase (NADPH) small chain